MQTGVTACLITYNEAFWLARTLPLMVLGADRVVVIDGGPHGPSDDGSHMIIDQYLRSGDICLRGTFGREGTRDNWDQVQRNAYLNYVETSHMLLIDADEAYLREDWEKFRGYAERGVRGVTYKYIHFYVDCQHRIAGGGWDVPCHHFTRFDPTYRYLDMSTILRHPDGTPVIDGALHDESITLFHYNRVSPAHIYKQKQAKFMKRADGGGLSDEEFQRWWDTWQDDRYLEGNPNVLAWEGQHPLEGVI